MSSAYDWSTSAGSNGNSDVAIAWPEGQTPGSVNNSARAVMGRVAEILKDISGAILATGTPNGIVVTANANFTNLVNGRILAFRASASNTTAVNLNVNSTGAKPVRILSKAGESALSGGEIQAGGVYLVMYNESLNSAAGGWQLINAGFLDGPAQAATRTVLKALPTAVYRVVTLREAGREGTFYFRAGNYASLVTADTAEAVYIAANDTASTAGAWVREYSGYLDIRWFGAAINNSSNDDSAWTAAVALATALGGGTILHPGGVSRTTEFDLPDDVHIIGVGWHSEFRAHGASSFRSLIHVADGNSSIRNVQLNGNSVAQNCIYVDKSADNLPVTIAGCYLTGGTNNGINWGNGDSPRIFNNTFIGAGSNAAILIGNDGRNGFVRENYILGSSGLQVRKSTQGAEGFSINRNIILPASGGIFCIDLGCGLEISITENIFDQIITGNAVLLQGNLNDITLVKSAKNWYGRQLSSGGADYGAYVFEVNDFTSDDDTFVGWTEAGIHIAGNSVSPIVRGARFYGADPCLRDIQLTNVSDVLIDGCDFSGSASIVENSGVTGRVINCKFHTALPTSIAGGLRYGDQALGMTLRAKGTATLAETTRIATITHTLSYTPAITDIALEAAGFAPNAPGEFTVDNIGATTFRGVCRNDPGAGGCPIVWEADIRR